MNLNQATILTEEAAADDDDADVYACYYILDV
jgi:hypothetical protein